MSAPVTSAQELECQRNTEITENDSLRRQLTQRDEEIARLTGCLVHIGEYWNGHETERAMTDACHHLAAYARQALTKEAP